MSSSSNAASSTSRGSRLAVRCFLFFPWIVLLYDRVRGVFFLVHSNDYNGMSSSSLQYLSTLPTTTTTSNNSSHSQTTANTQSPPRQGPRSLSLQEIAKSSDRYDCPPETEFVADILDPKRSTVSEKTESTQGAPVSTTVTNNSTYDVCLECEFNPTQFKTHKVTCLKRAQYFMDKYQHTPLDAIKAILESEHCRKLGANMTLTQIYQGLGIPHLDPTPVVRRHNKKAIVIPKILHQTSKSRCVTSGIVAALKKWQQKLPSYQYVLHDDDAVERLFSQEWPEFPHLREIVTCLESPTARVDLWRYLVIWEYGGIYTDIDTAPGPRWLDESLIDHNEDDGFFVIEQLGIVSQYFMALSPRHPLMYYAIQSALLNIWQAGDTGGVNAALVTGPRAIKNGFIHFMGDDEARVPDPSITGLSPGYVYEGVWTGTRGRQVRVVGQKERANDYVIREAVRRHAKVQQYQQMNMTHFLDDAKRRSGKSCLRHMMERVEFGHENLEDAQQRRRV